MGTGTGSQGGTGGVGMGMGPGYGGLPGGLAGVGYGGQAAKSDSMNVGGSTHGMTSGPGFNHGIPGLANPGMAGGMNGGMGGPANAGGRAGGMGGGGISGSQGGYGGGGGGMGGGSGPVGSGSDGPGGNGGSAGGSAGTGGAWLRGNDGGYVWRPNPRWMPGTGPDYGTAGVPWVASNTPVPLGGDFAGQSATPSPRRRVAGQRVQTSTGTGGPSARVQAMDPGILARLLGGRTY